MSRLQHCLEGAEIGNAIYLFIYLASQMSFPAYYNLYLYLLIVHIN